MAAAVVIMIGRNLNRHAFSIASPKRSPIEREQRVKTELDGTIKPAVFGLVTQKA